MKKLCLPLIFGVIFSSLYLQAAIDSSLIKNYNALINDHVPVYLKVDNLTSNGQRFDGFLWNEYMLQTNLPNELRKHLEEVAPGYRFLGFVKDTHSSGVWFTMNGKRHDLIVVATPATETLIFSEVAGNMLHYGSLEAVKYNQYKVTIKVSERNLPIKLPTDYDLAKNTTPAYLNAPAIIFEITQVESNFGPLK